MQVFILVAAGVVFLHPFFSSTAVSQSSDEVDSLLNHVQEWSDWSDEFSNYSVTVDRNKTTDDRVNVRTIQRDGSSYLCIRTETTVGKDRAKFACIQNPDYTADLEVGLNDEWVLKSLAVAGQPNYSLKADDMTAGVDTFANKLVRTGVQIIPVLLKRSGYSLTAVDDTADVTMFTIEFEPGESDMPDSVAMARLHFAKSGLAPPVQLDYDIKDVQRSRIFVDWKKIGEHDVPARELYFFPGFKAPGEDPGEPQIVTEFDYSDFEASFDTSTCYLTHYGLPEPSQVQGSNKYWWILVGSGAVLLIGGFIARQRASAA